MMKTILMAMTAVSTLAIAAPAAAQGQTQGQTCHCNQTTGHDMHDGTLQSRLELGVRNGAISSREAMPLRSGLRSLASMEREYAQGGLTDRERGVLERRGAMIERELVRAEASGASRAGHDDRFDRDDRDARYGRNERDGRFDRNDGDSRYGRNDGDSRFEGNDRGDRFAGDVRVGQRPSARMTALPERYRADYRDSETVYHRADGTRIYQVDRLTNLVTGMIDLPN